MYIPVLNPEPSLCLLPRLIFVCFNVLTVFILSRPIQLNTTVPLTVILSSSRFQLTNDEVTEVMATVHSTLTPNPMPVRPDMDLSEIRADLDTCPFPDESQGSANTCDPTALYRTIDGTCNNLRRPLWGRAMTPLSRWLNPDYCDSKC